MEANDFLDFCEEFVVFFLATGNLVVFLVCVNFDAKSCEKKKGVSTPENISMKEKVFSVHLNLRKLEHHYRITSMKFHTYTAYTS